MLDDNRVFLYVDCIDTHATIGMDFARIFSFKIRN